jgi:uncharacterized RDD family membrane protein YckC
MTMSAAQAAGAMGKPLDTLQRIELAEGVDIELRPAGVMVRACAFSIDLGIFIVAVILLSVAGNLLAAVTGEGFAAGTMSIVGFGVYWGYHVFYEAGVRGATPGKRRMGLRVVADGGGPAGLGAVMLRNVVRVADFLPWCYLGGLLSCLFTRRFQRLGDLVAHTLVVYETRKDAVVEPVAGMPPPLPVEPEPPPVTLTREERGAVVRFLERSGMWSGPRRREVADHASGLTGTGGEEGVVRLRAMGRWLRDS